MPALKLTALMNRDFDAAARKVSRPSMNAPSSDSVPLLVPLASIWKPRPPDRRVGALWAPSCTTPWEFWSNEARRTIGCVGWAPLYEVINKVPVTWSPEIGEVSRITRNDQSAWFIAANPDDHVRNTIFLTDLGTSLLRCERCGRVYDRMMRHVEPGSYPLETHTFQVSLAFCPSNQNGECHERPTPAWQRRQMQVGMNFSAASRSAMDALSRLHPRLLINSVFGDISYRDGYEEISLAYKALRVLWIRAFPALRPNLPQQGTGNQPHPAGSAPIPPSAPGHHQAAPVGDAHALRLFLQIGSFSLWGHAALDLELLADPSCGLTEGHLAAVYGVSVGALRHLRSEGWLHEMDWINAYAGLRHRVSNDHYMLMRTACQRVSTAMERLLLALAQNVQIYPGCEKKYALTGRRFHELLSAVCADMLVARDGLRAIDEPLHPTWWRNNATQFV